jgi:hypothetical protein
MRIHTDATRETIHRAAILAGVQLVKCEQHKSRTHDRAFEVSLRGDSRRRPNFYNGDGTYAATWDQWGIFLAEIFTADEEARAGGSVKRPVYADADDFDYKTGNRFPGHGERPADMHGDHTFRWQGVAREQSCTQCDAVVRWN